MITIVAHGSFKNLEKFLKSAKAEDFFNFVESRAQEGVAALAAATPVRTGATAAAWDYIIERSKSSFAIHWTNSNRVNGLPIAVILQYGHGTGGGGYEAGRDYINPAIMPIFDRIADEIWEEVTKL